MTKRRGRLSQTQSKKKGINNAAAKYFKAALDVGRHTRRELPRSSGAGNEPGKPKKALDIVYVLLFTVAYCAIFTLPMFSNNYRFTSMKHKSLFASEIVLKGKKKKRE